MHQLLSQIMTPYSLFFFAVTTLELENNTGQMLLKGSWRCSKPHPGWWGPSCSRRRRWKSGCCADSPGSRRGWWALCSGSSSAPCGTGRSRCSHRPESDPHSRKRAPSRDQGELEWEGWQSDVLSAQDLLALNQPEGNEESHLLPEKETSSLAGSAGSLTLAAPAMVLVVPSSLRAEKKQHCFILLLYIHVFVLNWYNFVKFIFSFYKGIKCITPSSAGCEKKSVLLLSLVFPLKTTFNLI